MFRLSAVSPWGFVAGSAFAVVPSAFPAGELLSPPGDFNPPECEAESIRSTVPPPTAPFKKLRRPTDTPLDFAMMSASGLIPSHFAARPHSLHPPEFIYAVMSSASTYNSIRLMQE